MKALEAFRREVAEMRKMEDGRAKAAYLPCQNGVFTTVAAVKGLYKEFVKDDKHGLGVKYILTARLNQVRKLVIEYRI